MTPDGPRPIALSEIAACFEGLIPAEIATASADGVPNVTHLSRVHMVDDERVALSNQFFSKTTRNLAENPHACVVVVDPAHLRLVPDDARVRAHRAAGTDLRAAPARHRRHRRARPAWPDVFKLRSADIYRVVEVEQVLAAVHVAEQ